MATNQFEEWIGGIIVKANKGEQLPTDRELGRVFNISTKTVARRLRKWADRDLITRIPGKGTFISGETPGPVPSPVPPRSSAQNIADRIYEAILSGEFKRGQSLPSIKYLSIQCKASYQTVINAYRLLQQTGQVTKVGKTFWVGNIKELTRPPRNREVFFFNYKNNDFTDLYRPDILGQAYQKMEKELLSCGYLVRYENTDNILTLVSAWKTNRGYPSGLVFCHMDEAIFKEMLPVFRHLRNGLEEYIPALLFDWHLGNYRQAFPGVQLFARGNILSSAARLLVQYLRQRTFGRAAVFMHENGYTWGFPASSLILFRCFWEMRKTDPDFIVRYVLKPASYENKHIEYLYRRRLLQQVLVHSQQVTRNPDRAIAHKVVSDLALVRKMEEQFASCREFPVWIFDRDEDAATAVAWAQAHGINIPGQLSIVTLQNDPKYYHLGLSYCGPDWETIGYQLAHALIKDSPVAKTSKGFLRTKAVVIEKLTTR